MLRFDYVTEYKTLAPLVFIPWLLESRMVDLRETISQPLFAACIAILNNSPLRLRLHEKSTVSFAAVGVSFTVQ